MAKALVEALEARGGKAFVRAPVAGINTRREAGGAEVVTGVTMADGTRLSAALVVAAPPAESALCPWLRAAPLLGSPGARRGLRSSPQAAPKMKEVLI